MTRQVVLMRGVNVGGHHKLAMPDLRRGLEAAGCANVVTYIQSGNVVLTPPAAAPNDPRTWLGKVIAQIAGFHVPLVLRTRQELRRTVEQNPYPDVLATRLHVVFFSRGLPPGTLDALGTLETERSAPEEHTLVGDDLYLHLPNGIGRAKLPPAIDRAMRGSSPPVVGTTRNWNTVNRIIELA